MPEKSNSQLAEEIDRAITAAASGSLSAEDSNGQRPAEIDTSGRWHRSLCDTLLHLYDLIAGLKDELDPEILPVREVFACGEFNRLRNLMRSEIMPSGLRADGNVMVGYLKAGKLVKSAPGQRDSDYTGLMITSQADSLPLTPELAEYVASIDPRALADILRLVEGIPAQAWELAIASSERSPAPGPAAALGNPLPEANGRTPEAPADRTELMAAAPPLGDGAAATLPETKRRPPRKVPRGRLDEQAAIELKKNPSLTYAQLAEMLKCNPTTLRDKRKCPLLAGAKAEIKAQKREFYGKDKWTDRRDDDE